MTRMGAYLGDVDRSRNVFLSLPRNIQQCLETKNLIVGVHHPQPLLPTNARSLLPSLLIRLLLYGGHRVFTRISKR